MQQLSAYRIMWLICMFDLPVMEEEERRKATRFRNDLLDEGFEMAQFSVYMRHLPSREKADALTKRVIARVPPDGKVSVITITDKQFGEITSYHNLKPQAPAKKHDQLVLL